MILISVNLLASKLIQANKVKSAIVLLPLILLSHLAHSDEVSFIEEVTIVGKRTDSHQISGAAQYIGEGQLQEQSYSDIQRILRQSPGVSLQIEDGYGLRPNISILGVATERSVLRTLL